VRLAEVQGLAGEVKAEKDEREAGAAGGACCVDGWGECGSHTCVRKTRCSHLSIRFRFSRQTRAPTQLDASSFFRTFHVAPHELQHRVVGRRLGLAGQRGQQGEE
jgi:hypothetical protein